MDRSTHAVVGFMLAAFAHAWPQSGVTLSLLRPGNEWVYQGIIKINGVTETWGRAEEKETLTLKVLSRSQSGDTTRYRISMRDSIHDRTWRLPGISDPLVHPKDTVIYEVRDWILKSGEAVILKETPDKSVLEHPFLGSGPMAKYSLFENTILFTNPASATGMPGRVQGTDANRLVWTTDRTAANQPQIWWTGWIADNAGLYWAKGSGSDGASCGPTTTREWLLKTFNGKAIDLGITPPGSALAKEARITCSAIAKRDPRKALSMGFRSRGAEVDFLGRVSGGEGR
jgi:hypothetical protein